MLLIKRFCVIERKKIYKKINYCFIYLNLLFYICYLLKCIFLVLIRNGLVLVVVVVYWFVGVVCFLCG